MVASSDGLGSVLRRERLIGLHESLPARIGVGLAAGGDGADQRLLGVAFRRKDGLIDHDRAAEQVGLAAGLLVLIEEVDGVRAAEAEIDRVDVVGQRGESPRQNPWCRAGPIAGW